MSHVIPPATDALHREFGGVVVGANIDPAKIIGDIVDPVSSREKLICQGLTI
jgi:hypothetical protein